MIEAYKSFWTNYFNFEGRTTRSGYWYVFLMNIIIGFVIGFLSGLLGSGIAPLLMGLYSLYSLAILIPGIAVFVRRLHDINKSGWWFFIAFIPLAGFIVLLVFLCTDSVNENNRYGQVTA